ncbi:MAG: hypothetical protein K0Q94_4630 [Paenibacillus sp.]|nr:hypothetical protein [Paenibacillus sp.]
MSSIEDLQKYGLGIYHVKDQLRQWVYDRSEAAFEAGDRARDEIRTTQELEARRTFMREKWLESAGWLPSSDHPLSPVITGTINRDGYRIEKIIFQSRPSTYVTSNMYIPDGLTGPSAAVLFLCGHSDNGKQYNTYQTVCQRLVAEGLIVFAIDPIGQGERLSYYDGPAQAITNMPEARAFRSETDLPVILFTMRSVPSIICAPGPRSIRPGSG